MSKKSESNLLFPVPDSGDVASDVWRLIIRSNAKMLNLLLQECPEIAPGQKITFSRIRVLTYLAQAQGAVPETVREHYKVLDVHAGDCIHCGACESRCPFKVKIQENMDKAAAVFGY